MELIRGQPSILWDRRDPRKYFRSLAIASRDGSVLIDAEGDGSAIKAYLKRAILRQSGPADC
jgi:hypothetical protein